jgi:Cytochrome P450
MIQDKIYEELENILQGSDRSHTMKDVSEMKYLERVIKEVLRLYPPLPIISACTTRDIELGKLYWNSPYLIKAWHFCLPYP